MDVQELRAGLEVLKLQIGDRLLIRLDHEATEGEIRTINQITSDWGLRVLVLEPGAEVSVIRDSDGL